MQRVEARWHTDKDGVWRQGFTTVCASEHRVLVQALGMETDE